AAAHRALQAVRPGPHGELPPHHPVNLEGDEDLRQPVAQEAGVVGGRHRYGDLEVPRRSWRGDGASAAVPPPSVGSTSRPPRARGRKRKVNTWSVKTMREPNISGAVGPSRASRT